MNSRRGFLGVLVVHVEIPAGGLGEGSRFSVCRGAFPVPGREGQGAPHPGAGLPGPWVGVLRPRSVLGRPPRGHRGDAAVHEGRARPRHADRTPRGHGL